MNDCKYSKIYYFIFLFFISLIFPARLIFAECVPWQCEKNPDCDDFPNEHCVARCCVVDPAPCTPVNGGWSGWSSCNNCSQSRTCTNPSPSCGGANCSGPSTQACGKVNGGWSSWSSCNNCSQSRTCTNPSPACGGAYCSGSSTQACGNVDGTLGTWSTCSTSCGPGTQTATCTKEATCGGTTCSTLCSNAGGTYSGTTCTRSCNLGPCNQNPKGNFDSVSCGSDPTSPNFHKIRVRGWACDPDNYSSPISVHVYNGTSSSGIKIGSGTANLPGELAIGSHCGGTTSHRFDILSAGTFAPGTYSINTYGINTPPGTNPLLSSSPKSVTCCAPTNGSLGAWGSCSNGSQTSTCSGFSCGGNCSAECSAKKGTYNPSTHVCTRNCLRLEGNIWSDDDSDGNRDLNEIWRGTQSFTCSTNKVHTNFLMSITGESGNQIGDWWCHNTYGAYYKTPEPNPVEPEITKSVTLSSLPLGYDCESWQYITQAGGTKSGTGCTATSLLMPSSGWVNVHFKLKCQTTSWGPWGNCVEGVQTRTCSNPDPICQAKYCLGSSTRPCLRLEGNIWSDDDNDGREISDYWKKDTNTPSGCGTTKIFSNFDMAISGETTPLNQIFGWFCHSNPIYGTFYNSPVPNAIEPESSKTVTLRKVPLGYNISGWVYQNALHVGETSGSGSQTTSLLMPSSGWVNINWELAQKKYNLKLKIREIPPEESDTLGLCSSPSFSTFDVMPGAEVTISSSDGSTTLCSGVSNSNGEFTCPIWTQQGSVLIEVRKDVGGSVPETYTMKCPAVDAYTYTPSPPPPEGTTINLNIGLQAVYKKGWVSAVDADIFADILHVIVPDGPTDNSSPDQISHGFAKTLINSGSNNNNALGFIFSQSDDKSNPDVERGCPNKKGFETSPESLHCATEYGGYAYGLYTFHEEDHKSIWLENFTFTPPTTSKDQMELFSGTITPGSVVVLNSGVYNVQADFINDVLDMFDSVGELKYRIDGPDNLIVLFIDDDITIPVKITTTDTERLLLVVNGSVTISEDVGTSITPTTPMMTDNPHIMAGIIAKDSIITESQGTADEDSFDKTIMFTAPLVSKSGLTFSRDLYHDNNATMPAESVKAFNKYLYLIASLERNKSSSYLYYTGVSTYDLDWEYIY